MGASDLIQYAHALYNAHGDKAEAGFKNGVLTIKLPQTPEAKAKVKRIEVQAA